MLSCTFFRQRKTFACVVSKCSWYPLSDTYICHVYYVMYSWFISRICYIYMYITDNSPARFYQVIIVFLSQQRDISTSRKTIDVERNEPRRYDTTGRRCNATQRKVRQGEAWWGECRGGWGGETESGRLDVARGEARWDRAWQKETRPTPTRVLRSNQVRHRGQPFLWRGSWDSWTATALSHQCTGCPQARRPRGSSRHTRDWENVPRARECAKSSLQ